MPIYDYEKLKKEKAEADEEFRKKCEELEKLRTSTISLLDVRSPGYPEVGRIQLGSNKYINYMRLVRFLTMGSLLEIIGPIANRQLYEAGRTVGKSLAEKYGLSRGASFEEFVNKLQEILMKEGIGIPEVVKEEDKVVVRLHECIASAGMANVGMTVCHFEAGIINGIYEAWSGQESETREVSCWGKGDNSCTFVITKRLF